MKHGATPLASGASPPRCRASAFEAANQARAIRLILQLESLVAGQDELQLCPGQPKFGQHECLWHPAIAVDVPEEVRQ